MTRQKTEQEIITDHYRKIGAKGGSVKSEKKTLSSRENARKPRKKKGDKNEKEI